MNVVKELSRLPVCPSPKVSSKYVFLDSREVVNNMADLGWHLDSVKAPIARTVGGRYGLHMLDFRQEKDLGGNGPLEGVPRILLLNSYDGSRRAQLVAGWFRFVCTNGMISGFSLSNERFLHFGQPATEFSRYVKEVADASTHMVEKVGRFRNIELSDGEVIEFAERAAALRWREGTKVVDGKILSSVRRRDDAPNDLWTVYNRVQENLIRGGSPMRMANGRRGLSRPLVNLQREVEVNRSLWDLMETYAEEQAA